MSRRPNPRADLLRQAVADEAARIMREQGVDDFLLAKRKAADRLGVTDASKRHSWRTSGCSPRTGTKPTSRPCAAPHSRRCG
jgi:hypothetical protein